MNKQQAAKFVEGYNHHVNGGEQINRQGYLRNGAEACRSYILYLQVTDVIDAHKKVSIITEADIPAVLVKEKEARDYFQAQWDAKFNAEGMLK